MGGPLFGRPLTAARWSLWGAFGVWGPSLVSSMWSKTGYNPYILLVRNSRLNEGEPTKGPLTLGFRFLRIKCGVVLI